MGRKGSTKRFIAKGEGQQKFFLVHRSQTDNAYASEDRPSEFVLVRAGQNGIQKNEIENSGKDDTAAATRKMPQSTNHITELGFKNDGYDYSQHLKVMGGGRFIGKSGISYDLPSQPANLPSDSLPSEFEFDRQLHAITISHEYMDEDIRQALFDENNNESGQFEELSDNFVMEAMEAPEEPDFDFDKHIANLIANSERSLGSQVAPRGWEGINNTTKLKSSSNRSHHYDDNDNDEDDEVESYDIEEEEEDEGQEISKCIPQSSTEHQAFLEEQLARTLEEYDDDEIGSLEDREEEIATGTLDDDGRDMAFTKLLDDFLTENTDRVMAEGVKLTKGSRVTPLYELESEQAVPLTAAEAVASLLGDGDGDGDISSRDVKEDGEPGEDLLMCQEYLRETRIESEWDCETILTTYSTLENHPTIISAPKKPNNRKNRNTTTTTDDDQQSMRSYNNNDSNNIHRANTHKGKYLNNNNYNNNAIMITPTTHSKIELSGKLMLPKGFISNPKTTPAAAAATTIASNRVVTVSTITSTTATNATATTTSVIPIIDSTSHFPTPPSPPLLTSQEPPVPRHQGVTVVPLPTTTATGTLTDDNEIISDNDNDSDSESEETEHLLLLDGQGGKKSHSRRNETADERKIRKLKVKEERRLKRASKKHLKQAYRQEGMRVTKSTLTSESGNVDVHTSVFKY